MEGVWCLPLILALLSLLLHHHSCTGRQLHDGLYMVSPDYLTDRHVGNSKMLGSQSDQIYSTTVEESVEQRVHRAVSMPEVKLEPIQNEANTLDGLLKEEKEEQKHITKNVNDLKNVEELCQYMSNGPLKWQKIEKLLMKIEEDLALVTRYSPTLNALRLTAFDLRATKKTLEDSREKLLASAKKILNSNKNECPNMEAVQAKARRQLEIAGEKEGHVDFLLTLESWKQKDIRAKLTVAINEHAIAAETSKTAKVDKIANAHTQFSDALPNLYIYVLLEKESKKWETIESILTEMEDDLGRVQHAEESLRKRVKGFHERKALLKVAQERLMASVETAVGSEWFKQAAMKQIGEAIDLSLQVMDEDKKKNEVLLGRVKDGKVLDSETKKPLEAYYHRMHAVCERLERLIYEDSSHASFRMRLTGHEKELASLKEALGISL